MKKLFLQNLDVVLACILPIGFAAPFLIIVWLAGGKALICSTILSF